MKFIQEWCTTVNTLQRLSSKHCIGEYALEDISLPQSKWDIAVLTLHWDSCMAQHVNMVKNRLRRYFGIAVIALGHK